MKNKFILKIGIFIAILLLCSSIAITSEEKGHSEEHTEHANHSDHEEEHEGHKLHKEHDAHEDHKGHNVHQGHGDSAGHGAHGGHGEESWWRFPGWQLIFAAIACLYFALVLAYLPMLVAKDGEGGHH